MASAQMSLNPVTAACWQRPTEHGRVEQRGQQLLQEVVVLALKRQRDQGVAGRVRGHLGR